MKNNFEVKLQNMSNDNNFELSDSAIDRLSIYKDLLLEWNQKINLTAITDEDEIIVKHFIDSLQCTKYINSNEKIIDIGTGAGFPGLVVAIYFDDNAKITLVDSLNKRINFLNEVICKLHLKNVQTIHARAEDLANDLSHREKYDVALSRAVASTNILLEYTTPYIEVNGRSMLMKANDIQEELKSAQNALKKLNCKITNIYKYELKASQIYERNIVEITKFSNTPKNYPRSFAKIKKNPL